MDVKLYFKQEFNGRSYTSSLFQNKHTMLEQF